MYSKSCSSVWPDNMPRPKFVCSCPPWEKCLHHNKSLWKPASRRRRPGLLSLEEKKIALTHAVSEPLVRQPSLLDEVSVVVKDVLMGGDIESHIHVEDRLNERATELARMWNSSDDDLSLAKWVGVNFPDDSVAVVWWTDILFDQCLESHAYEDLLGQSCTTWMAMEEEVNA